MTAEEARRIVIDAMNYAAYRETDSSLYDSDKNRLYGSDYYNSGRSIERPSPWAEGDIEKKMVDLLRWANYLNAKSPQFKQAQMILRKDKSFIGRTVRRTRREMIARRVLRFFR